MNKEIKHYIQSKLSDLEKDRGIRIVLAVESGSRAWGFASPDSDYDVRFIYMHDLDHYLSLDKRKDTISTDIIHDDFLGVEFDLSGWDIKKAIYLAARGNAVVNEWITSPIQYISLPPYTQALQTFIDDISDLRSYGYFYKNYMRDPWDSYLQQNTDTIKIKHYCYVLRCALALKWLDQNKTPPPMNIDALTKDLDLDQGLHAAICDLIALKSNAKEVDTTHRHLVLDQFINEQISKDCNALTKDEQENNNIDAANILFRDMVLGHLN